MKSLPSWKGGSRNMWGHDQHKFDFRAAASRGEAAAGSLADLVRPNTFVAWRIREATPEASLVLEKAR